MSRSRAPLADVQTATRQVLTSAAVADPPLRPRAWRVLAAVLALTSTWTKLEDTAGHTQIGALAGFDMDNGHHRRNLARDLHDLADRGLIVYLPGSSIPGEKRTPSTVGLPRPPVGTDPQSNGETPGRNRPPVDSTTPGRKRTTTPGRKHDGPPVGTDPPSLHNSEGENHPSIDGRTDGASYEEWKDQVFEKIRDSPKVPAWVITRIADDSESKKNLLRAELSKAFHQGHGHGAVARALAGRGGWEGVTVVSAVMASRLRDWLTNNPTPAAAKEYAPDLSHWFDLIDGTGEGCLIPTCPRWGRWRNRTTGGALCNDHALREMESSKAVVA